MKAKVQKPPGKKLIKRMSLYTKYVLLGAFSVVLIGGGLAVLCQAAILKFNNEAITKWLLTGVYAYILIFAGLFCLQNATRFKTIIDVRKMMKREMKKRIAMNQKAIERKNIKRPPFLE